MRRFRCWTALCLLAAGMLWLPRCAWGTEYRAHYGSLVTRAVTMENPKAYTNNVVTHNSSGYHVEPLSTSWAHTGERSYYIDYTSATGQLVLAAENLITIPDVRGKVVYAEAYIKGLDPTAGTVYLSMGFRYQGSNVPGTVEKVQVDEPDENGWIRMWTVGRAQAEASSVAFSVNVARSDQNDFRMTDLYVDDMRLILAPENLAVQPVTCECRVLPLSRLRVMGYDAWGNSEEIFAKDQMQYGVHSGDAQIDEAGNLIAGQQGVVWVQANFWERTCLFPVTFTD